MMEETGYELKNAHGEGKYLSAKLPGMKRVIRLKTLGDAYSEESIRRRVPKENLSQYRKQQPDRPRIVYCRVKRYRRAKMSGLQKKYYARLYRIGKLKKKPYSAVWKYKDEIKKMHRLQEEYKFLARHNIHSVADLALVTDSLNGKKKEVSAEKSRVYRADHKNKELYEIAGQMRELAECENSFLRGDVFFEEEHKRYQELAAELREKGYSYEEVAALKEHYHGELARYRERERAVIKEIRLAESVRRNYAGNNDETRGLEQEKKREQKQEMQPKR
jgi:hypothetical protein